MVAEGEDTNQARVVHKTGISNTVQRDYSIINRVRSIDQTNDKFLKRSRSTSRTRPMPAQTEPSLDPTIPKGTIGIKRVDSTNWTERGTKESIGGVLGIVKNRSRSVSRGPGDSSDRGRSSSRSRGDGKGKFSWRSMSRGRDSGDESGDGGGKRGRSSSRGPLAFLRGKSNSRDDKGSGRGRSKNKRDKAGKSKKGPKLPPLPPTQKVVEPPKVEEPPEEPEVDDEIDKLMAERQLIAEVEAQNYISEEPQIETRRNIDSLNDHDIMQLDEKNTTMHVACLLHHSTSDILQRLDEEPDLANSNNKADETPLHYAAMDKRGVNKEVLKTLIQLNPEAVKQPNVQDSLPVHLACMVGAPSSYAIKTFLKMYPKAAMIQSDFPLLFEDDMTDTTDVDVDSDDEDDDEFVSYKPKSDLTAVSGIASMFACAAPHQAALEMAHERSIRKQEKSTRTNKASNDDGPKIETGFSPLHLAVMNSASPSIIELLIKVNKRSIYLKTSRGRTALDCAQYIVRQHWLYGTDDENAVQNTFGAIELLEEALDEE